MRKVVWSDDALDDLDSMIRYIVSNSVKSAGLVVDRIEAGVDLLAEVPAGRLGRVKGTYEKHILRTPYIVVYSLSDEALHVLRIIHGSRDWPEDGWPKDK